MYILIPLLLIRQLILRRVVVKFDKLNPAIGNTATVPFVGDLMASRWAFEAGMVTQFKDNKFENEFYRYDKVMADADYKKIYFIPELETRLEYCLNNFKSKDATIKRKLASDLALIKNEVIRQMQSLNKHKVDRLENMTPAKFDSAVYQSVSNFLSIIKRVYINRYNAADREKEKMIHQMTDTP